MFAKIEVPPQSANFRRREQTDKESTMNNYRTCAWCNQVQLEEDFTFSNKALGIKKHYCRFCDKSRQNKYYYSHQNELLEKKRAKYREDKPKYLESTARYRKNNAEKIKKSMAEWATKNPAIVRKNSKKRKAITRGALAKKITPREIKRLLEQPCFYCKETTDIQIDHVVPISRGGLHSIGNLLPACKSCNSSKNKWFITEWKMLRIRRARWH